MYDVVDVCMYVMYVIFVLIFILFLILIFDFVILSICICFGCMYDVCM